MWWRAHSSLQEKHESDIWREVFRFKSKSTPSQTYGSIQKEISRHDIEHQISICKKYISEEVKRGHSKNKIVTKPFCPCRQNK